MHGEREREGDNEKEREDERETGREGEMLSFHAAHLPHYKVGEFLFLLSESFFIGSASRMRLGSTEICDLWYSLEIQK